MSSVKERPLREIVDEIQQLCKELASKTVVPTPVLSQPSNQKKLTRREADRIRDLKRNGFSQRAIADIFDISPVTVSRIVRGIYWK